MQALWDDILSLQAASNIFASPVQILLAWTSLHRAGAYAARARTGWHLCCTKPAIMARMVYSHAARAQLAPQSARQPGGVYPCLFHIVSIRVYSCLSVSIRVYSSSCLSVSISVYFCRFRVYPCLSVSIFWPVSIRVYSVYFRVYFLELRVYFVFISCLCVYPCLSCLFVSIFSRVFSVQNGPNK